MTDASHPGPLGVTGIQTGYMALVRRRRMYSGLTLAVFVIL